MNNLIGKNWSLKYLIRLLGVLLCITVVLAGGATAEYIRHSETVEVREAEHQLELAAREMQERYIKAIQMESKTSSLAKAKLIADENHLRTVTQEVLSSFSGVEGGFYSSKNRVFLGYAYPTYKGSGPKTDVPPAEQGSILKVIETAQSSSPLGKASLRIDAGDDVLLFYALRLPNYNTDVDAVWVMHHLHGVRSPFRGAKMLALAVLFLFSSSVITVAWILSLRLDGAVATIESALSQMEAKLDTVIPHSNIRELDRISDAITRLGESLRRNEAKRNELEKRLRQADRLAALGRLVAGVAHEVRNPLASIKLKLDLARKYRDGEAGSEELFTQISEEIARVDRILNRLLTLGRASRTGARSTDLHAFLQTRLLAHEARALASNTSLELIVEPQTGCSVVIDQDRLSQIVDNLILNALDATKSGAGRVLIAARLEKSGYLSLTVSDNGPGVPPEIRERLFEPFITTKEEGTGLGLFVAAELARALGGELRYRDNPPSNPSATGAELSERLGGACFELILPCQSE